MDQDAITFRRCADIAANLSLVEGWGLSETDTALLAQIAVRFVSSVTSDEQIVKMIANIYCDRNAVESLRSAATCEDTDAWLAWFGQAQAILRHSGYDWVHDDAVDLEDLAQIGLLELLRSLPNYRYQSRFSTWAYQVISRGVQRHIRNMNAQKRSADFDRSVDPLKLSILSHQKDAAEYVVAGALFGELVESELSTALGDRTAEMFRLWACYDFSVEMISQRVGLSTSRVYALIDQARRHLRSQSAIQQWSGG